MASLEKLKSNVEDFLTNTEYARILSEKCRDYKDHKQWTAEEANVIKSRGQAPIVVNRIKPKVDGIKGLIIQRKTDPKAFPRTQKHEKAAEAITDGLRFVSDNNNFDDLKVDVADNVIVEGYGAVIIEMKKAGKDREISLSQIPWDRYFYDFHSRRLDFQDKRWDGIILWMDAEEVIEKFNIDATAESFLEEGSGETFEDRPRWVDKTRKRVRVCQHFYIEKGVWMMCYHTHARFLIDPKPSPYLDEFDEPTNPIESVGAYIDRDNNRFGEVRFWLDLQDEINHRRSKFLHLLSVRQTMGRRGAVADVQAMKRELAKANGHVEYDGEKGDFDLLKTGDMAEGQFVLLNDAKNELDAVGFNAQMSGQRQGDLSGKAIANLQNASTNELTPLFAGILNWERRVYRQQWMRMKQFWDEEKWIRVTDDQESLRWVGFNQKITLQQKLEEQINDDSLELQIRQESSALFQKMMSEKDPRLQNIIETKNNLAELDLDIMIESASESINAQAQEFELLANIAQTRPEIPFEEIVRLSTFRAKTKDKLIKNMQASRQSASERQQALDQVGAQKVQAEIADKSSGAQKKEQEAIQTHVQTQLILETPPDNTGVVI